MFLISDCVWVGYSDRPRACGPEATLVTYTYAYAVAHATIQLSPWWLAKFLISDCVCVGYSDRPRACDPEATLVTYTYFIRSRRRWYETYLTPWRAITITWNPEYSYHLSGTATWKWALLVTTLKKKKRRRRRNEHEKMVRNKRWKKEMTEMHRLILKTIEFFYMDTFEGQ